MNTAPAIGQPWPGQGGIYAGIIRDTITGKQWHLIMAATALTGTWGNYGTELPGEFSLTDGKENTALIIAADSENKLLSEIAALSIDCHSDFYLPAQKELNLLYINLQDQCEKHWHWSSTQYSAYYAWCQDFGDGDQSILSKDNELAARAVRRELVI